MQTKRQTRTLLEFELAGPGGRDIGTEVGATIAFFFALGVLLGQVLAKCERMRCT